MQHRLRCYLLLPLILLTPSLAMAGSWGELWGTMTWESSGGGPTAPEAPTITDIESTLGGLIVFFTPGGDGGDPITSYTVTCGSESVVSSGSPTTVTGLDGYTSYDCTVTASNGVGTSVASAASSAEAGAYRRLNIPVIKAAVDKQTEQP